MTLDNRLNIDHELLCLIINSLEGVAITDKEGRYIYVNQSWTRMMDGLTIDDVYGKHVRDIIPESGIYEALEKREPVIGHGVKVKIGNGKDAFTSYYPIIKDGELVAGFIHVIITGLKSAQEFTTKVNTMTSQIEYYKKELRKIHGAKYSVNNIIGKSSLIADLRESIKRAALTNSTVLIEGETGCGKELVAHAIHDLSPRTEAPLIKINCAAIPTELLESEFFGYCDGAFTGARKGGKAGKFQLAENGSIFLDEINQMPLHLQPKLLRGLQEKEIEQVGGKEPIPINVRVIVASNVNLKKMVESNKFRSDLFYRLNVVNIKIPPLRERREDIPLLCMDIIEKLNYQLGMLVEDINPIAIEKLMLYDWPGNVRELQNVIERAMNMARGQILEWQHFKDYFETKHISKGKNKSFKDGITMRVAKAELEKDIIIKALETSRNNKTVAADSLGISRMMLYKKIKKYNI
ncbi:sigma-54 interaction domain-containing protein [Youngiibacter fragilis]|uniref:Fis family transcriptional regulator n=1 Tax=Youngiibacter fragilis 232.1 TaxID=994573 RepID=V7ICH7_9CLOT|nr:sigma-54-dependent Fis family transcriptional regulator [Youngiibacter fragilis]ETA82572.1 Fis family transcriptional regulator [Youngiibacter fragilis 232.1]